MPSSRRGNPKTILVGWVLVASLALLLLPGLGLSTYWRRMLFLTYLNIAMATGWNLVGGFAGQVSFGYSTFFGGGAYAVALLSLAGVNPLFGLALSPAVAGLISLPLSWLCFRLRGSYFAIATLGIAEAVRLVILNTPALGGASGLTLKPLRGYDWSYAAAAVTCALAVGVAFHINRSDIGLALRAIADDEDAARSVGVSAFSLKTAMHLLGAMLVGLCGGIYVADSLFVEPRGAFSFNVSISMVLMPVIGGVGTVVGPVLGAIVFAALQELLLVSLPNLHLLTYGILVMAVMLFEPKGLCVLFAPLKRMTAATLRGVVSRAGSERGYPGPGH